MKIPLRLHKPFNQWQPFILLTIVAPRARPTPIEALIDTGSPWMALAPKDLLRLNISRKHLQKPRKHIIISFAAHKFNRFELRSVSVRMKNEKGGIVTFNLPSISALWPTKKKWPDEIKHIPSVLGTDFLTTTKLGLHFNPSKEIAFLETET